LGLIRERNHEGVYKPGGPTARMALLQHPPFHAIIGKIDVMIFERAR